MNMAKAKAGLRGLSALKKEERASIIHTHMSGNPAFPDPTPSMAEFGQAIEEFKEANMAAMDRGHRAIQFRNIAEQRISDMITRLAGYVNSVCLGDSAKILSAGFDTAKESTPITFLNPPRNARVRATSAVAQLVLRWGSVPGVRIYEVQEMVGGTHGNPVWGALAFTSNTRLILDGRRKDEPHVFQVRALGARTESTFTMAIYSKVA